MAANVSVVQLFICGKNITGFFVILHWTTNFKNFFVSVMNMLLIYLFASMKLEKGHKKNYLALVLKLCYTMIFYEIG